MDSPIGILVVILVIAVVIALRIWAGSLDRERIRKQVESHGGKVIDIVWNPLGDGSRMAGNARLYEVRYRTHHGTLVTAKCATILFSRVWWLREAPPGFSPEGDVGAAAGFSSGSQVSREEINRSLATPAEAITCLTCGATIPPRQTPLPQVRMELSGRLRVCQAKTTAQQRAENSR